MLGGSGGGAQAGQEIKNGTGSSEGGRWELAESLLLLGSTYSLSFSLAAPWKLGKVLRHQEQGRASNFASDQSAGQSWGSSGN